MSNIYKNAMEIYKQDADHYRDKYIDATHTISVRDDKIEELKADNDKEKEFSLEMSIKNDKLKAEIGKLKEEVIKRKEYYTTLEKRFNNACEHVDELKAEIKTLKQNNHYKKNLTTQIEKLQADNDRLRHDHNPQEYKQEADEWFEHNPQDEKLFFFMVGGSGVDEDGDVINTLNIGCDAIAECDNFKGVISVETYK